MSLRKVAPAPPGLRTWGSVGILFAIWVVACWPWLGGRAVIGWDSIDYVYPQMRFFAQSMSRGELPWWNPYSFGGTTVIGDPQGMFFVPHTLAAADAYSIVANDIMTLAGVLLGAIACEANAPAELVLNDAMAPGWTACVGNSVVPIGLVDGVFRRVAVPAGRSVVVMAYQGLPWLRTAGSCPE